MNRSRRMLLSSALVMGLGLTACQGPRAASVEPSPDTSSAEAVAPPLDRSPVGSWGKISDHGTPFLELREDGQLSGSDGCNRLIGKWTPGEDQGEINLGLMGSTMMACQELETWLNRGQSARVEGTTLVVLGEDGAEVGRLTRNK